MPKRKCPRLSSLYPALYSRGHNASEKAEAPSVEKFSKLPTSGTASGTLSVIGGGNLLSFRQQRIQPHPCDSSPPSTPPRGAAAMGAPAATFAPAHAHEQARRRDPTAPMPTLDFDSDDDDVAGDQGELPCGRRVVSRRLHEHAATLLE